MKTPRLLLSDLLLHAQSRRWRVGIPWSLCLALSACSSAPGMRLDTDSAQVKARADVLRIDAPTVLQLRQELRQQSAAQQILPPGFERATAPYQYLIAPQDVLQVTVWNRPELNNPSNTSNELSGRVINADGSMYYPFVGAFKAAGHTVQAVRDYITESLLKVIKQPQVDVSVLQYRGQRVVVSGEVRTPGTVPVTDIPPDLTEVIAKAGGVTAEADLSAVTVTRGAQTARVDLQALYYGGDMRANLRLRHGDVVHLPERRSAKVFVTGEVIKPTALLMPRGTLTLADALADAGGVNPLSANAGQVYVLRSGGGPKPKIYHLNAAAADALLLADQFVLQARDVVYVDAAAVVRWARVLNNVLGSSAELRGILNDATRIFPR